MTDDKIIKYQQNLLKQASLFTKKVACKWLAHCKKSSIILSILY